MPIYEYECGECRHHFDKRQQFHDEPKAECPKCKGQSKRVMVPAPVIFKGSGFYVNDYPNARKGTAATEGSPAKTTPTKAGPTEKTPAKASPAKSEG
jgi:putative FmdB family regulatory protein